MKKSLIMTVSIISLFVVLNACCCKVVPGVFPGKVEYSKDVVDTIKNMNIRAFILVDGNGQIFLYDENFTTENVDSCILPEPDKESRNDEDMKDPELVAEKKKLATARIPESSDKIIMDSISGKVQKVCKGMSKGSAVTSIRSIFIMKTNSDNCLGFGGDGGGGAREICW